MIKIGIAGADTPMAGELIRILINHPDADILAVNAPGKKGERVDMFHHGLAGECDLLFTELMDPSNLDVVFIDAHSALANHFRNDPASNPELRIIDMSHGSAPDADSEMVYALSEINRKQLVRSARKGVVPRSVAAVSLLSLLPLAENMMLPQKLEISVDCPPDILVSPKDEMARRETSYWLRQLQSSFSGDVSLKILDRADNASPRGIRVTTEIPSPASLEIIKELYEKRFDDHSLTLVGDFPMDLKQVEGTDKCLIGISETPEGKLKIEGIADCRMRGGAGDAVHTMNLMFGLLETTGLRLKAHTY